MDEAVAAARRDARALSEPKLEERRAFNVLTMAFVHHLVSDSALADLYDYAFKLDADVAFLARPTRRSCPPRGSCAAAGASGAP